MRPGVDDDLEIVIPFHGDLGLLQEAVASVLGQSDPRWRLVVVEDGDQHQGTAEWIADLADSRVRHLLNPTNLGICGNFQRCLDVSTSPWVLFLGCDDVLLPEYVAVVRRAITNNPHVSAIQPAVQVIDSSSRPINPLADRVKRRLSPRFAGSCELAGEPLVTSLMRGNWTYFPAICWRRDDIVTAGFRQDLPTVLDLALLLDLACRGRTLLLLDDVAFGYRRHAASASSLAARSAERFEEEARLFSEVDDRCRRIGWRSARRAARRHTTSRLHAGLMMVTSLRGGHLRQARGAARHAFSSLPSRPGAA